ncbi:MAG: hypothetical protein KDD92_02500 [Caldilineaceae bacterium]|nr:hypothetical protein [Caldilineaceae bacterium]
MTLFRNRYRIESARLPNWDYSANAWYFITICTQNRRHFFGRIEGATMRLSKIGDVAARNWADIPLFSIGVRVDEFMVMPNHLHGIIVLERTPADQNILGINQDSQDHVETLQCNVSTSTMDQDEFAAKMSQISPRAGSVSAIVRSYKSAVTRTVRRLGFTDFGWQARFYDSIIRHERSLQRVRAYIQANPARWDKDRDKAMGLWM